MVVASSLEVTVQLAKPLIFLLCPALGPLACILGLALFATAAKTHGSVAGAWALVTGDLASFCYAVCVGASWGRLFPCQGLVTRFPL